MELYLKRTVLGVAIYLTTDEALRFVQDPAKAQAEVANMLRGGGIDPETGRPLPGILEGSMDGAFGAGREGSPVAALAGRPAGALRLGSPGPTIVPAGSKKTHHKAKGHHRPMASEGVFVCPVCKRDFDTEHGLAVHRTRAHGRNWSGKPKGTSPKGDARAAREQAEADMRAEQAGAELPEDDDLPPEVGRALGMAIDGAIREALDGDDLEGTTAPGE